MNDKRLDVKKVLTEIMVMVQNAHKQIDMQMLQILHMTGYCGDYIVDCPLCLEENKSANQVTLDDFTGEEE